MKQLLIPLSIGWLLMLGSCKKEAEPQLPPATQIGANTLGFKVNGEVWVPYHYNSTRAALCISEFIAYKEGDKYFGIFARRRFESGASSFFNIITYRITTPEDFTKIDGSTIPVIFLQYDSYPTRFDLPGKLVITRFDTIQKIVSGEFEFSGTNTQTGETVQITEGRFDVTFDYCQ